MNGKRVEAAARVIHAEMQQGKQTAGSFAAALESAQLLMSPEKAAELTALRARVVELEAKPLVDRERVELLTGYERALAPLCSDVAAAVAAVVAMRDPEVEWLLSDAQRLQDRIAELEAAPATVYRASHDSIVMGLYTTAAEARKHCEAEERHSWAKFESLSFDWIEDEEDGVAELTVFVGGEECSTGYVVTALEIASEYDEEASE